MKHHRRSGFAAHCLVGLALIGLAACSEKAPDERAQANEQTDPALPRYSAEAFYQTTSYSLAAIAGYAFAPDGAHLLISSDATGIFNAYALPVDGGAPEALTGSEDHATFAVSYFPSDSRFLYTFDEGGNELNQIYVAGGDLDEPRNLTPGEKTKASFAGWLADGSAFFLTTNERDARAFDLYRYDAETYDRTRVFENADAYSIAALSPDGTQLALVKSKTSADSDIYLADLAEGGAPVLLTEHEGEIAYGVYDFTPDGERLIYATNEAGEFSQAWSYELATGDKAPFLTADWDISFVSFSPSGRYTVYGVNADAQTDVTVLDTVSGDQMALPDLPAGNLAQLRFDATESQMALMVTSSTSPADVFVVDLDDATSRRLTNALNPEIDESALVDASVARFESYDGLEIPGILYKPKQATADSPVPALVWVHGGPGGQSRIGYSATIQHLVNHGYAIYAINNRGSSGYGKTFFHLDDKMHGEADLGDVVASKGFLAAKPWIDGDRIGIIGGSYGGYMVTAAMAFEPDVFDVGIDIFGVTNWLRTLKSIPPWWDAIKKSLYDEMGDPATDEERLRRISSLFHADQIKNPMLVVQGANDPRVLQVESDELVAAIKANGVPVEYIVFPDEGHGFRNRENRIRASEAYLAFLDRHLKGERTAAVQ